MDKQFPMKMKPAFFACAIAAITIHGAPFDLGMSLGSKLFGDNNLKSLKPNDAISESSDNSIDPDYYEVGPGDAFQVAIVEMPSQDYSASVGIDGNLYIPELGVIELGRITLTEAAKKIESKIRANLKRGYQVRVSLRRTKSTTVTVTGEVSTPGSYQFQGTFTILDAIKAANKNELPEPELSNLRRIAVVNRDSTRHVDLIHFLSGRSPRANPYLYPGDQIHVPAIGPSIRVAGHIQKSIYGRIPLNQDETVGDILNLISYTSTADTTQVIIKQGDSAPVTLSRQEARVLKLGENDVITIPGSRASNRSDTVSLTGEFVTPGTLPILTGKTSVFEALQMSGGYTEVADTMKLTLIRHHKLNLRRQAKGSQSLNHDPSAFNSIVMSRPEISASMHDLRSLKDYVIMNLDPASAKKILLLDGDEIHVPRQDPFIYISGHVKKPGIYPFVSGNRANEYIETAGGPTDLADIKNAVVITRIGEFTQVKPFSQLQSGDIIVIPASTENKRLSTVYIPLFQVFATVLSLAISILIATK